MFLIKVYRVVWSELSSVGGEPLVAAALDSLSVHIALLDAHGRIVAVNAAWRAFGTACGVRPSALAAGANYLAACDADRGEGAGASRELAEAIRAVAAGTHEYVSLTSPLREEQRWFAVRVTRYIGQGPARVVVAREDVTERTVAEERMRHQLAFTGAITSNLGEGILALDRTGRVTFMNPAAERLLGWNEADLLDIRMHEMVHPRCGGGRGTVRCLLLDSMQVGTTVRNVDDVFARKDGSMFPALYTASPILGDGGVQGAVLSFQDITARKQVEERLRLLESVVVQANDGIVITEAAPIDPPGPRILYVNAAFTRLTGYSAEEVLGQTPRLLQGPGTDRLALDEIRAAVEHRQSVRIELLNYRKGGDEFWVELNIVPVADAGGRLTHWIAVQRDVTERKRAETALRTQALYDALTGLPNRTLLQEQLEQALVTAGRERAPLALLLLDVDRFKEVNDTFGHQYGDVLLQQIGPVLRGVLRMQDTTARLGGDEFTVLLPGTGMAGAVKVAGKLLAALDTPLQVEGQPFLLGASVGIALYPDHGTDAQTLLRHADVAMYLAKGARGGYALYDPAQDQHSPERLKLIADLRQAIEHEGLMLHYQPKVALDSGRLQSVEVLVRWQHPEKGLILPDQFIALAEQTGLIMPLTWWVLGAALRQCQRWQRQGLRVSMAVNLSMWNLHDPELPVTIAGLLQAHGVSPELLHLELTESTVMSEVQRAAEVLERLSALGVRVAIDDFGTGYSSLAYLKRLPVDELKIDKSFVLHMASDEVDASIVRSIIALAHNLGLQVVAEGVEDRQTWEVLAALGCDSAQGYYVSRPLPSEELERWLRGPARIAL